MKKLAAFWPCVLLLLTLAMSPAKAQTVNFSVHFGYTYQGLGAAPDALANTNWNALVIGGTTTSDVNSDGSASAVTLTLGSASQAAHGSVSAPYNQPVDLFHNFTYSAVSGTLNSVSPGTYNVFVYGCNANYLDGRIYNFTVSSVLTSSTTQTNSVNTTDTSFVLGQNYVEFMNLAVGSGAQINFSITGANGNTNTEADFNGLQLQAVPEPSGCALALLGMLSLAIVFRRRVAVVRSLFVSPL